MQLGGSGALHAAFLNESRIRGRVQSSVLEIRGMGDMLLTGTQLTNRTGMYGKEDIIPALWVSHIYGKHCAIQS